MDTERNEAQAAQAEAALCLLEARASVLPALEHIESQLAAARGLERAQMAYVLQSAMGIALAGQRLVDDLRELSVRLGQPAVTQVTGTPREFDCECSCHG